jgi:opacity protein-like surface antigen
MSTRLASPRITILLVLSLAAVFSSTSVQAQSPYSWNGMYVGGNAGFGWGNSGQTDTGCPFPLCLPIFQEEDGHYGINGGLIGGTLGYNWQSGSSIVGIESDYSWAEIKGHSDSCGLPAGHPCGTKVDSFGTARARIGMAIGGTSAIAGMPTKAAPIQAASVLPYITGGLAFGEVHGWDSLTPSSGSKTYTGWTVGGGIEWRLQSSWSAKIEYLYADLGKHQLFDVVPGLPETVSVKVNIVRVGLNYKFGN